MREYTVEAQRSPLTDVIPSVFRTDRAAGTRRPRISGPDVAQTAGLDKERE
jgi:hypothetical protein